MAQRVFWLVQTLTGEVERESDDVPAESVHDRVHLVVAQLGVERQTENLAREPLAQRERPSARRGRGRPGAVDGPG